MEYKKITLRNIKNKSVDRGSKIKYRNNLTNFTRDRKMSFEKVIYYNLNKKGLTSKMEIEQFDEIVNTANISSSAVLKQREKLNAQIYKDMMIENIKAFYNDYQDEVKLFKGYILSATDGSDFEIPNTADTRKSYNSTKENTSVARAHVSNSFDVLNHYILSTVIGEENSDERKMDEENLIEIKALQLPFKIIRVKDRGYVSLKDIYYSNKLDDKFVTRLKKTDFEKQIRNMKSNDEIIEIPYQYDRIRYYKDKDYEFYELMEQTKKTMKIRIVKIIISTGEPEYLMTNLNKEEVNYKEMNKLYNLRWQIELNYHTLKECLKIETITSSKDELIKQDIYSQMLVFNTLQAFVEDARAKIEQKKYKYEMKININMAVGFFKKFFILLMIEEDELKKNQMLDKLEERIEKYIIPVRKGRNYPRSKDKKNRYSVNKRKSF